MIFVFQHAATRRWLLTEQYIHRTYGFVSTHSRPKAAAILCSPVINQSSVSTHSYSKVAAAIKIVNDLHFRRFQHTATRRWLQNKESAQFRNFMFQHTATRRWLPYEVHSIFGIRPFQHTAARRRLPKMWRTTRSISLFQHTAARRRLLSPNLGE